MDRRHELENLRRSMAMLRPEQMALTREQALALLTELAEVQEKLDRLRVGLRALVEQDAQSHANPTSAAVRQRPQGSTPPP